MKNVSRMAAVVLAACIGGGLIAVGQPQPDPAVQPAKPDGQRARPDGRGRGTGELTSVDSAMKLVNRSVRRLKGQIADPEKKEENLRLVGDVERAVVFAKSQPLPDVHKGKGEGRGEAPRGAAPARNSIVTEQPEPKPEAKPGAEPKGDPQGEAKKPDPKATEEYRRRLLGLLKEVVQIEQDLMDGKFDEAKKELDKVPTMRDEAHKALGVKEDEE